MATASRTVRRLRLRAPSEAAVRRAARVLEDALRTATLPDAGGRILFVRQLALGRLRSHADPMSVALALEKAVARVGGEWRHGEEAGAGAAPGVWFRDPLEAHLALARRVLAGALPAAWYWPLAVPGWSPRLPRDEALRVIAHSLAARAEAPVALPRWFGELVRAGHRPALEGALRGEDVEALARAAGVRLARSGDVPRRRASMEVAAQVGAPGRRGRPSGIAARRLIQAMLAASGGGADEASASLEADFSTGEARTGLAPERLVAGRPGPAAAPAEFPLVGNHGAPRVAAASPPAAASARTLAGTDATPRGGVIAGAAAGAAPVGQRPVEPQRPRTRGPVGPAVAPPPWLAPTSAGGLLFLLNALERVGYAEWLVRQPDWEAAEVARRLLFRVMMRLALPAHDPAWELAAVQDGSARVRPRRFLAPPRWRDGLMSGRGALLHATAGDEGRLYDASGRLLLAGWRGPRPRALLADCRGAAPSPRLPGDLVEEVVGAWEVALRRWLRRFADVSVADLVLRTASLAATPTHLDVHFDLALADPEIRRAGLDLDPGWVPWFGRVVGFHYQAGVPS